MTNAGWSLEWVSGSLFSIVNRSGGMARNVRMSTSGPVLATTFGVRDWSWTAEEVADGAGHETVLKALLHYPGDPLLVVEWVAGDGGERRDELEIPG